MPPVIDERARCLGRSAVCHLALHNGGSRASAPRPHDSRPSAPSAPQSDHDRHECEVARCLWRAWSLALYVAHTHIREHACTYTHTCIHACIHLGCMHECICVHTHMHVVHTTGAYDHHDPHIATTTNEPSQLTNKWHRHMRQATRMQP